MLTKTKTTGLIYAKSYKKGKKPVTALFNNKTLSPTLKSSTLYQARSFLKASHATQMFQRAATSLLGSPRSSEKPMTNICSCAAEIK